MSIGFSEEEHQRHHYGERRYFVKLKQWRGFWNCQVFAVNTDFADDDNNEISDSSYFFSLL